MLLTQCKRNTKLATPETFFFRFRRLLFLLTVSTKSLPLLSRNGVRTPRRMPGWRSFALPSLLAAATVAASQETTSATMASRIDAPLAGAVLVDRAR